MCWKPFSQRCESSLKDERWRRWWELGREWHLVTRMRNTQEYRESGVDIGESKSGLPLGDDASF